MKLLLDTHVLLWWLSEPEKLTAGALAAIEEGGNEVFVSAVTIWEAGIKQALGKLDAAVGLLEAVQEQALVELPISWLDGETAASLPPIHQDPFDRLLVAQAMVGDLTLVTRDVRLADYGVAVLIA